MIQIPNTELFAVIAPSKLEYKTITNTDVYLGDNSAINFDIPITDGNWKYLGEVMHNGITFDPFPFFETVEELRGSLVQINLYWDAQAVIRYGCYSDHPFQVFGKLTKEQKILILQKL